MKTKLIAVAGLTVIWVLLWGRLNPLTVLGGLVVAAVVVVVFPLPPIDFGGRVRPVALLRLAGRFAVDLVAASFQVAALAFRFGHLPRSAVIAVRLEAPTDLGLTLTATLLSLVPGSLIVEADRESGVLYIHVLNLRDPADAARFRRSVLELESRVNAAIPGSS
jgi:multicomponent Na+:H+ antiporter subunit E